MGKRAVAVSLGLTYCVVMVAWGFALVQMAAWVREGIPMLARSIDERVAVVVTTRPVLVSPSSASYAATNGSPARHQPTDCDPTEPTHCVWLPNQTNPPPSALLPRISGDRAELSGQATSARGESRTPLFTSADGPTLP